jgi:hypothetical protein
MRYVDDQDYLQRGFLNGQLEINNKQTGKIWRGDISGFGLEGKTFTVTVSWMVEADEIGSKWKATDRSLTHTFNMDEWDDQCHGEGRIGLTSRSSRETFLIVPRRHYSHIERPIT